MTALSSTPTLLDAITVRDDATQPSWMVRALSVALMTLLTAAAAQISVPLPFTLVPLTFQPMVVLLSGLVLGSRLGFASQMLYLSAGIAGLPVWAASATLAPGLFRLLGPTGGYLMVYPFAAFAVGLLAERGLGRRYVTAVLAMLAGLVVVYAGGVAWLGMYTRIAAPATSGFGAALAAGVYPFIAMDVAKSCLAAAVVPALWRLVGRAQ